MIQEEYYDMGVKSNKKNMSAANCGMRQIPD